MKAGRRARGRIQGREDGGSNWAGGRGGAEKWLDSRVTHFVILRTSCLSPALILRGLVYREEHVCKNQSRDKCSSAVNWARCIDPSSLTKGDAPEMRVSTPPGWWRHF